MKIEQAENGFVVTKSNGDLYIYKTLREMADDIEGRTYTPVPAPEPVINKGTVYAADKNANHLSQVKRLAERGYKIDAIKELRSIYSPKLGLKEAKELVESMVIC